jgi:glycosyltransferase involved in cell wall biosynthesis
MSWVRTVSNTDNLGKPLVTVGLCVRNNADSIGEAIKSIVSQDFPHDKLEIIFVNDGSTDKTAEIIVKFISSSPVNGRLFSHPWKGIGYGRNIIAKNALGKYLLWVDGDMTLSPGYISRLVDFMEKNPKFAIVKGFQELKEGSNLFATLELLARSASRMVDYTKERNRGKALGTGGAIYRTEAIKGAGFFDDKLTRYGEDQDIELRIRKNGWKLSTFDVSFQDYERLGIKWKNLYKRYYVRGYSTHYFLHKNPGLLKLYNMSPPLVFMAGLFQAKKLFIKTHYRESFLLPFFNVIKMSAWYVGFLRSHNNVYQPK